MLILPILGAVTIDPGCAQWNNDVNSALGEAVSIANYAASVWQSRPTRPGTLLQDMLGASSEDDQDTLTFAQTWFQKAAAAGSDNLVIYCSDTHLNNIAPGKFRDPQNGNSQVTIGNSNTACGGALRAFAYPASGRNAIVLCSDSGNGALRSYHSPTFGQWNTGGDFRLVNSGSINTFGVYLSYKILHELFHCADFQQFPARLPSGIAERYEYGEITGGVSADDRRHNADSMALLGCGEFLKL
ncbi:hypothetical protein G7Y79_00008g024230 [Physcia stellaris]|nr:hypothetical protein G7Y79_00008g024230 [Physcia stellaris]